MITSYQPIDSDTTGRPRRLVNGRFRETRCDLCGEWTGAIGAHRGAERCCSAHRARELMEAGYVRVPTVRGATAAVRRVVGGHIQSLTGFRYGGPCRYAMRTMQRWAILPSGWEMGPQGPRPLPVYEAPPAINQIGGACWSVELIGRYKPISRLWEPASSTPFVAAATYGHPLAPRYAAYSLCGSYGYRVGWGHLYRTGLTAAPAAKCAALVGGCCLL